MIPLRDDNPAHRTPVVTVLIIAACVGTMLWMLSLQGYEVTWAYQTLGAVPSVLLGRTTIQPYIDGFPPEASVVTSLFVHAGLLHLAGNMLFLWVFGNNVEDKLGHRRFLVFYLVAGVVATSVHVWLFPDSDVPVVGASGAVSGVLGAYLLLFPHARVRVLFPPFIFRTFRLPAWMFLGFWFVLQGFLGVEDLYIADIAAADTEGGVAWAAHVGGFVAGLVLVLVMRPKGVALFHRVGQKTATVAAGKRGASFQGITRAGHAGSVPPVSRPGAGTRRVTIAKPRKPTVQR